MKISFIPLVASPLLFFHFIIFKGLFKKKPTRKEKSLFSTTILFWGMRGRSRHSIPLRSTSFLKGKGTAKRKGIVNAHPIRKEGAKSGAISGFVAVAPDLVSPFRLSPAFVALSLFRPPRPKVPANFSFSERRTWKPRDGDSGSDGRNSSPIFRNSPDYSTKRRSLLARPPTPRSQRPPRHR